MKAGLLVATCIVVLLVMCTYSNAQGTLEWDTIGPAMNSPANEFVSFDDGTGEAIYACGDFTLIGSKNIAYIAKWTGNEWVPLGSGINGEVKAIAVFDDGSGPALYATGRFTIAGNAAAKNIAKWDGNEWSALGSGLDNQGRALAVFDHGSGPRLYVGGDFQFAGGENRPYVAAWSGSEWSHTMNTSDGYVECLEVYEENDAPPRLIAGGSFTQIDNVPMSFAAGWDGSAWVPYSTNLPGQISALGIHDRVDAPPLLYCFTYAGNNSSVVLRWVDNRWEPSTFPPFMDNIWNFGFVQDIRDFASIKIDSRDIMFAAGDIQFEVFSCTYQNNHGVSAIQTLSSDAPLVAFKDQRAYAMDKLWIGEMQTLVCSVREGTSFQVKQLRVDRSPRTRFTGDGVLSVAGTACDSGDVDFCDGTANFAQATNSPGLLSVSSGGQTSSGKVTGSAMVTIDIDLTTLGANIDIAASTSFQQPDVGINGDWGTATFRLSTGEACDFGQFGQFVNHPLHIWVPTTSIFTISSDSTHLNISLTPLTGHKDGNQLSRGVYALHYTTAHFLGFEPASASTQNINISIRPIDPGCIADLTEDNRLDFFDVSAFLDAFGAEDTAADFTADGLFDFFDVSAFLDFFSEGCP